MKSKLTYGYRFTACLLLLLYLLSPLRVFQPFLTYQVNYEYISKVLCVNKDKPKLECNGKCHLKKELKKQTESDSENPTSVVKLTLSEELIYPGAGVEKIETILIENTFSSLNILFHSDADLNKITPPHKS